MFVSGHVSRVTLVVDNKLSRAAAGAESQSRRPPLKLMTNSRENDASTHGKLPQ